MAMRGVVTAKLMVGADTVLEPKDRLTMPDAGDSIVRRVVLTRPAERQQQLASQLRQAGFEVLELPALTITPITPVIPVGSAKLGTSTGMAATGTAAASTIALAGWQPARFDVLVFVSRGAWQNYRQFYLDPLAGGSDGCDLPWSESSRPILACVGLPTAHLIAQDLGLSLTDITYPSDGHTSDSEGLWAALKPRLLSGMKVLIVRGQTGRDWLAQTLEAHGLSVTCLSVYQREPASWTPAQVDVLNYWANTPSAHPCVPSSKPGTNTATDAANPIVTHTGTWLITSAQSLEAIAAQYDAHGLTGKAGSQPQAVVVVHQRLVPLVQAWLGKWQSNRQSDSTHQLHTGGVKDPRKTRNIDKSNIHGQHQALVVTPTVAVARVPVVVTAPDDEAILSAMLSFVPA